jgi:hypothetical protein
MADAREEPRNETPAQRRERLLNLNNPDWELPTPEPAEDVLPHALPQEPIQESSQ